MPYVAATLSVLFILLFSVLTVRMARDTARVHEALTQTTYDLSLLDAIVPESKTYATAAATLRHSLPSGYAEVSAALTAIDGIARTNQISLDTQLGDAPVAEAGIHSLIITMRTSGSYSNLRSFMSDLALIPYHTSVNSIALDSNSGLTGIITVKLFIQ